MSSPPDEGSRGGNIQQLTKRRPKVQITSAARIAVSRLSYTSRIYGLVTRALLFARTASPGFRISKKPNGVAKVQLTDMALDAFRGEIRISRAGAWLFPNEEGSAGYQRSLKTVWRLTLHRAKVPYFRIYDLRSTYATRLSAGGIAGVTQLLREPEADEPENERRPPGF
jgi:hypothetical protein